VVIEYALIGEKNRYNNREITRARLVQKRLWAHKATYLRIFLGTFERNASMTSQILFAADSPKPDAPATPQPAPANPPAQKPDADKSAVVK